MSGLRADLVGHLLKVKQRAAAGGAGHVLGLGVAPPAALQQAEAGGAQEVQVLWTGERGGGRARGLLALAAQKAHLDEQYRLEREALETKYKAERVEYKASTEKKTQQDYKDLKAVHLGELD